MPGSLDPAHRKRLDYLRAVGRPALVRGSEFERAIGRVRAFNARGMSFAQMQRQTGLSHRTISSMVCDKPGGMLRSTWVPIMRMQFEEPDDNAWLDPTGAQRRLGALWMDGFPIPWLLDRLGCGNRAYLQKLARPSHRPSHVVASTARQIRHLYDDLDGKVPGDFGIDGRKVKYCGTFARKQGCVPRHVWDPDTIDDPEAFPEWTGACGTEEGARIHVRERIPVCGPCSEFQVSAVQIDRLQLARHFDHEAFKRIRKASGYSQAAVERAAGLCLGQIHHWESGRHIPRDKYLIKALEFLQVGFEDVSKEEV